jgi:hypothetical protein
MFATNTAYRCEARVRNNGYSNGVVTSFFLYGYDGTNSDEIDFEFVSKQVNDEASYPNGDPVLTNPWNESSQNPQYVAPAGLDLSEWNTFRIYWHPGERVEWTWLDPVNGETTLRIETNTPHVADEAMALYCNFWAPTASWGEAHDVNLHPATNAAGNEVWRYDIDYVEVRVTHANEARADLDGDGLSDIGCYDAGGNYVASPGSWYFMTSSSGFVTETFGYAGTVPVVGDFDGDGLDDYGCYDDTGNFGQPPGSWYFMTSSNGFRTETFGYDGTVPVVGDFDGDGLDDYGCYDDTGNFGQPPGSWYLMMSSDGFDDSRVFGYAGTVPLGTALSAPGHGR